MQDEEKTKEQLESELVEIYSGVLLIRLNDKCDGSSIQQLAKIMSERLVELSPSVVVVEVAEYIEGIRKERTSEGHGFALHDYVHHGLSSQALLFNLIVPLIVRQDLESLHEVLRSKGMQWPSRGGKVTLEYEDRQVFNEDSGQPTSIDLVIGDPEKPGALFVECKFTESGFGGCSGEPADGTIKAEIRVYNDAPLANGGSEIVFMGVGLVVIDGRERGIRKLNEKIKTSRPSDHVEERQKYNQGEWFSGTNNERFPAYTSDENSHGQILFPGESVLYEITVSEDTLPYLDIRVEGSVSRRHLFHISRPMLVLKERGLPLVAETFQALDKIDLYSPLLSLADALPAFSPKTTLADLDVYRGKIEEAIGHVKQVMPELNKVFHSAPNQELRDLMKQHIGKYLTTSERMCNRVLETLSGSDTGRMKESTEELKAHLLTLDEVKRAKVELMSQFGIDS